MKCNICDKDCISSHARWAVISFVGGYSKHVDICRDCLAKLTASRDEISAIAKQQIEEAFSSIKKFILFN